MVMTVAEVESEVRGWANTVNGRDLDEDGGYGAQCVDLILHYIRVVHGEAHLRGHGVALADNLISQRGWTRIAVNDRLIQSGDVISLGPRPYGHVMVAVSRLADGRWVIVDQNSRGTGDKPVGGTEIRTVTLGNNIVAIARPPRYTGATAEPVVPTEPPKPAHEVLAATRVRASSTEPAGVLSNTVLVAQAAKIAGVPLHIAAALIYKESRGLNIYGHDWGGVYSTASGPVTIGGTTYPTGSDIPVTRANYLSFLDLLLSGNAQRPGVVSNGVGPAQITYYGFHVQARQDGVDLSDPLANMVFGLRLLAGYLGRDYTRTSVEEAGTLYNAGSLDNGVNAYGRSIWYLSEQYRKALVGSDQGDTVNPLPDGPDPSAPPPPDPATEVTRDPGPAPTLDTTSVAAVSLPDPLDGPWAESGRIIAPTSRLWWRDRWWSILEADVQRSIQSPGPDQNPMGGTLMEATARATITRPTSLSNREWSVLVDSPPAPGEAVILQASTDGGETWVNRLTGVVDDTAGSVGEFTVELNLVDETDRLRRTWSHPALSFRQPSPLDGGRYLAPGIHPAYLTSMAVRKCGFLATPPMPATAMVSVPMLGSMWPERGTLEHCTILDQSENRGTIGDDAPECVPTWWGFAVANTWARYKPARPEDLRGRLTTTMGVRMLVDPPKDYPAFVELYWGGDTSVMIQVRRQHVRVECQVGWRPNGWRRVTHTRTRTLTNAQRESGFELDVWLHSGGRVEIVIDGDSHSYDTPLISWPEKMRTTDLQRVSVAVRPFSTIIGGLIVASTADRSQLGDWTRNFRPEIDTNHMLWGMPAIHAKPAIELCTEQSEGMLSAMWLDERGILRYVERHPMDGRKSVRTITEADLVSAPWRLDRGSVVSHVSAKWRYPTMNHRRMSSGHWMEVWESPKDALEPGQIWEQIVDIPDDEDWVWVDGSVQIIDSRGIAVANRRVGSVLGGTWTAEVTDAEGRVSRVERDTPMSYLSAEAWRVNQRAIGVRVIYDIAGRDTAYEAALSMHDMTDKGLSKSLVGRGLVLRARGKQTWADRALPAEATGAKLPAPVEHVHDGGIWLQSSLVAERIRRRLLLMLAQPIPTWGPVEMAVPDLSLSLGDTVTLSLDGVSKPQRVCGIRETYSPTDGATQTLTLRQLRP